MMAKPSDFPTSWFRAVCKYCGAVIWVRFLPNIYAYRYQDEECHACGESISLRVLGEIIDMRVASDTQREE